MMYLRLDVLRLRLLVFKAKLTQVETFKKNMRQGVLSRDSNPETKPKTKQLVMTFNV